MEPNVQQTSATNQQPTPQTMPPTPPEQHASKIGPIAGIIIIILVLLLGVLYFWGQRAEQATQTSDTQANTRDIENDLANIDASLQEDATRLDTELDSNF